MVQLSDGIWIWLTSYDWTYEGIAVTMAQLSNGMKYDCVMAYEYDWLMIEHWGHCSDNGPIEYALKYDCWKMQDIAVTMVHMSMINLWLNMWGHCSDNGPIEYALKYDCWKMQDIVVTMVQLSVSEGILRTLQCQWSNWRMAYEYDWTWNLWLNMSWNECKGQDIAVTIVQLECDIWIWLSVNVK